MLCGTVTTFLCKSTDAGSIIIYMYHGSASSWSLRRTRGFCANAKIVIMRSELLPTSSWHPRFWSHHDDTMRRKTTLLPPSLFSKHNGHLLGLMMMQWTMDMLPRNHALLVGDSFCSWRLFRLHLSIRLMASKTKKDDPNALLPGLIKDLYIRAHLFSQIHDPSIHPSIHPSEYHHHEINLDLLFACRRCIIVLTQGSVWSECKSCCTESRRKPTTIIHY
jgi:hypothetical protein